MQSFIPSKNMVFATVETDKVRLRQFLSHFDEKEWQFDLSEVNLCDSAGVALLIEAERLSKHKDLQCHFYGATAAMKSLIQFCGVEKVLFSG